MKSTVVKKASFREVTDADAKNYAEAILEQCPEIERNLVTVTRQFAKCRAAIDIDACNMVWVQYLSEAIDWQNNKGSKAYYRDIKYDLKMETDK